MKIKPPTKLEESGARAQTAQVGQRVDGTRNVVYVVLWTLYKRHPPPTPIPTTISLRWVHHFKGFIAICSTRVGGYSLKGDSHWYELLWTNMTTQNISELKLCEQVIQGWKKCHLCADWLIDNDGTYNRNWMLQELLCWFCKEVPPLPRLIDWERWTSIFTSTTFKHVNVRTGAGEKFYQRIGEANKHSLPSSTPW